MSAIALTTAEQVHSATLGAKQRRQGINASASQGNALWFILIAVALLGALTMTLSRGGSSSSQNASVEQNRIKMSQIMRYAKSIETAIQKLQQVNGCSENQISFENPIDTNYENTNAPDDESCHIFEPEGAGLTWQEFDGGDLSATSSNVVFSGLVKVEGVGTDADPSGNELIFLSRVTQSLCTSINQELGISTTPADITITNPDWDIYFSGAFTIGGQSWPTNGGTALEGRSTGCVLADSGLGDYVFYHVLLAR